MEQSEMKTAIRQMLKEKNAVLLAHYYQREEIQEIADFVGDSLNLAKQAAETDADIIVFSGVHFMAETAKIINPNKKVLLPDLQAGCSLADGCPPDKFAEFLKKYPDHKVVTYVNCSAEVKAMSDYICTSSNAVSIIQSFPENQKIIFAPDKNLGLYLKKVSGRDLVLWEGSCVVHEAFSLEKLVALMKEHPTAELIAHPESEPHILQIAKFVGSTAKLIRYVKESPSDSFIIATEAGILYKMQQEVPEKILIPAPAEEDNTCACSECAFMKVNTLEKVYNCLKYETPEILMDSTLQQKALKPLERMLSFE